MDAWISDEDMRDVAHRLSAAFAELLDAGSLFPTPLGPTTDEIVTGSVAADVEDFLELDRAPLERNFELLADAKHAAYNDLVEADVVDALNIVQQWQGEAARGFADHVSYIRSFATAHADNIDQAMVRLLAAYQLGLLARRDYYELAETTIAVIAQFAVNQDAESRDLTIKIAGGVAAAVIGALTGGVGGVALATVASGITSAVELNPSNETVFGDTAESITSSYRAIHSRLRAWFEQDIEALASENLKLRNELVTHRPKLLVPLPPATDVNRVQDSRYFQYIDFYPVGTDPAGGPDAGNVDRTIVERTAAPEPEPGAEPSPIQRALEPDR